MATRAVGEDDGGDVLREGDAGLLGREEPGRTVRPDEDEEENGDEDDRGRTGDRDHVGERVWQRKSSGNRKVPGSVWGSPRWAARRTSRSSGSATSAPIAASLNSSTAVTRCSTPRMR